MQFGRRDQARAHPERDGILNADKNEGHSVNFKRNSRCALIRACYDSL
jgi:hypothetical protein